MEASPFDLMSVLHNENDIQMEQNNQECNQDEQKTQMILIHEFSQISAFSPPPPPPVEKILATPLEINLPPITL